MYFKDLILCFSNNEHGKHAQKKGLVSKPGN